MTNEDALRIATGLRLDFKCESDTMVDFCNTIIKALKQESCEDCISRQAVLDALDKSKYSNEFCEEHNIDWSINLGMAHIVVNELKPVTPQPKIGHWIEHPHEAGENWEYSRYECSECHVWTDDDSDYCPNCGAKMEVATDANCN